MLFFPFSFLENCRGWAAKNNDLSGDLIYMRANQRLFHKHDDQIEIEG